MLTIDTIKDLLEKNADSTQILSLYLSVDPAEQVNQNSPRGWEIYAKNALSDVQQASDKVIATAIHKHTEAYLEDYSPSAKSLILFVDDEGVIDDFELPVKIDNYHSFGDIDVVQLLWSVDEYERYLVVLVDSEKARFLSTYLGNTDTSEEMRLDFEDYDFGNKQFVNVNHGSRAEPLQASGGDNFEDMKAEHIRRFHNDVATQMRELVSEMNTNRVILGGDIKSAHQVKDLLHNSVQEMIIDILSLPVPASDSKVSDAIQSTALNYERSQEFDLVEEVIGLAKAEGRGALGQETIRDLLKMQQVELLILSYPLEDEKQARELTTLAITSGANLELVHGSAAKRLDDEGKMVARLYYPIPSA